MFILSISISESFSLAERVKGSVRQKTHTHTYRASWSVWGLGGYILTPSINPLSSRRKSLLTHTQMHDILACLNGVALFL